MYENSLRVREAREKYFETWGLDGGGYTASWVTLKQLGPLRIGFPNSPARIRAVKMHDLHHVATAYDANWMGEAEIGAWEIGAGCHRHFAAWVLNLIALVYGVLLSPTRALRAFARGRASETLYRSHDLDESILAQTVGELRTSLGLDSAVPTPNAIDVLQLACWWTLGLVLLIAPFILLACGFLLLR